jgi:FKBP-type peptidyl-prolyl cis-trans isomerase FkpA
MRIKPSFIFALLLASVGLVSCIDENETDEVILARDKEAIADYIAKNTLVSVQQFEDPISGIRVIWQEVSKSGIKVQDGDTLRVDYTGKLLSNKVFDTSIESVARTAGIFALGRAYIPLKFPLGRGLLIPGFEYGVSQMEKGDKATVFIPSMFGYGNNSSGDIPANSPLIFELSLIDVKDGPQK